MATPTNGIKVTRSARLVSPKGRCSYPHVFKPSAFQGEGEAKYSVQLLLPKAGAADFIAKVKAAQEAALKELYPTKRPQNLEVWGIEDGDEKVTAEGAAVAPGNWIIKASNKSRPAVIDAQGGEIIDELEVYGGCYFRFNINAKAYGTPAKGGVSLELNVVQKLADGEAFGGAKAVVQKALAEMGAYEEETAEEF